MDTAYTGALTEWKSESAVLLIGGVWAAVAAVATLMLFKPESFTTSPARGLDGETTSPRRVGV
jgi:hypothetical protein